MRLELQENPREWRRFTLTSAGAVALLGLLLWWRRLLPGGGLQMLAGVLLWVSLLAWVRPRWLRGFYRVGMTASYRLGWFMGQVWLTLFFLGLLTPLGLALRLLGKDLLRLRRNPRATTYWTPARAPGPLDRMF